MSPPAKRIKLEARILRSLSVNLANNTKTSAPVKKNSQPTDIKNAIVMPENLAPLLRKKREAVITPIFPSAANLEYSLLQFEYRRTLGQGGFGHVNLAWHKLEKKLMALKFVNKRAQLKHGKATDVVREKKILQCVKHPFIVNLYSAFEDEANYYLALEYVPGGDLLALLKNRGKMPIQDVTFYSAQLVLALQFLHSKNIIHRDLKLSNVLLNSDGYIKLADFGLSKKMCRPCYRMVGTTKFMAPEILLLEGYSEGVDWWALGVTMYTLYVGANPFYGETEEHVQQNILEVNVSYPASTPKELYEILEKLLEGDQDKRYGSSCSGLGDIKQHEFFHSIDFKALLERKVYPPYIPHTDKENELASGW